MLGALDGAYSTCVRRGERDQPKQLDTAVTPLAILYEAPTMTLMAAWLRVGGIRVYTQDGRGGPLCECK